MDLKGFTKILTEDFYPLLRKEGFKGSGSTLRRINGPLIHVFNVQGSSGGERCYINLGAHLAFLSPPRVVPAKIAHYECHFRDRIEPVEQERFGWPYGESDRDALANVEDISRAWLSQGHAFFARYDSYPESFVPLVQEFSVLRHHYGSFLVMVNIARRLGLEQRAVEIAQEGLSILPDDARALRLATEEFLAGQEVFWP